MEWFTGSPWPILGIIFGSMTLLTLVAVLMQWSRQRHYTWLLEHGELAAATVLKVSDSGWRTNKQLHIRFHLEVCRAAYPPYQATATLLSKPWSAISYPPGSQVQVRVDQDHPERVAIVGLRPVQSNTIFDVAAASLGGVRVNKAQIYLVNGNTYEHEENLPPEARAALRQAADLLGDQDGDGIPDVLAGTAMRSPADSLTELQRMRDAGLVSQDEYEAKRHEILGRL